MSEENQTDVYDLIIIGGGPAGLSAAIYACRYKLSTLILSLDTGGTANNAHDIANWPGFQGHGFELMDTFKNHAEKEGAVIKFGDVKVLKNEGKQFLVSTETEKYHAKSVILAMGTKRRKLNIPGEDELAGKGVSYCATCDAAFFKDKIVGVVGGSNSAAMAGQILAQHASKVIIIYRKEYMRAEPARVQDLEKNSKVEFQYNRVVTEIQGDQKVEYVMLDDGTKLEINGLFIEIGGLPITSMAEEFGVELSKSKKIIVDKIQKTNLDGVFAAGDITTGSNEFDQVITAAAEGAIAALGAFKYVKQKKVSKD